MNSTDKKNHLDSNGKQPAKLNRLAAVLVSAAALASGSDAWADSNKLLWSTNGHYYQRFERTFTWDQSKAYCEGLSGHLATITSLQENDFVRANLLDPVSSGNYYYLGASDAAQEGFWKWITGETWSYVNFDNFEPDNTAGENYITIRGSSFGTWFDSLGTITWPGGLICEWSYNNFVSSTAVPDVNNNGRDDIAALYVDYKTSKHIVLVRDGNTNLPLKVLPFATNDVPPLAVGVANDLNANGSPEIAVLYQDTVTGLTRVLIKDVTTAALLKNFVFLNLNFTPKNMTVTPDLNGNGFSEITVIGTNKATGGTTAETRDSSTGALLENAQF